MIPKTIIKTALLLCSAVVFLTFSAPSQAADCAPFPKLDLWGDLSHDSVQRYVEDKFDGDWDAYVERLKYIKKGLQNIHSRGKGALIKMKGKKVVVRGKKLENYLHLSNTRIGIVRCLADAELNSFQNFATAAGGDATGDVHSLDKDDYRTYLTLPNDLMAKLRKQAVRRSLIENQKVSVNDIITRTLRSEFEVTGTK